MNSSWIMSPKKDFMGIILPGLLSILFVFVLGSFGKLPQSESPWVWLFLVVFIDVAHVWSTLFRTYFHQFAAKEFEKELFIIPLMSFLVATLVYVIQANIFWRILAYIAVYHFIKQQIGFLKIYLRKEKKDLWYKFQVLFMYFLMLYPVIFWHTNERSFFWFEKNDFISLSAPLIEKILYALYLISICIYLVINIKRFFQKVFNLSAFFLCVITGGVWFVGIIPFNNDFAFTLTNVVNHGVPYLFLIYSSSLTQNYSPKYKFLSIFQSAKYYKRFIFMLLIVLVFGYFEESLWDLFIWHEHQDVFFHNKYLVVDELTTALVVGALITPQLSHYILDGIIWKRSRKVEEFRF